MTLSAGNVTRMVASYSYDDIGRLVSLKRSGNAGIVNYAYNIRNWLKETKSDRFSQNLWYETTGAYPCFNGNISRMQWQTSKDNVLRGYDFAYDGSFDFKDGANADVEYLYDANGALVKDLNKGISNIEYDVLGNLKCITFSNGFKTKYIYDAAGNKLRTTHESVVTNTTDYIGNFVFEDGKLSKYLFDGGYCSFDQNQNPVFHYCEKDHLGSVRMVVNENGTIEQVNHYYPFGGVYGDLSYNSEYQKSKYIGKEFDHMHGLDWYDHGARMYDAAKVVWNKVDPLSKKYFHFAPYLYCENNPIVMFDNTGLLGVRIVDMENKTITVSADYYVETQPYQVYTNVYSQKDVDDFNRLNSELNKLNLKVKSGEYAGFTVVFNLNFISAGNYLEVNNLVSLANEGTNTPMANSLRKSQDFEKYFDTKEYADGSTATVGGATDNNQNIVMNVNFDTEKNRLHEIFHTFGFEHPKMKGGSSGIMCYPPRSPNAKDAQLFGSDLLNDVLPFIKKMKKILFIILYLCFAISLKAKLVTGTFIYYNLFIISPNAYPVCIDGFFEKDKGLRIQMCHCEKLIYGLLKNSYICPFLMGVESSLYCQIYQQKFGVEKGFLMYISELQRFSKEYDGFSKCEIKLTDNQMIILSLCAMSGSFEIEEKKNVSYNSTLGVDLTRYKDEFVQLMYPIRISSYCHINYKLIDIKKGKEKKVVIDCAY